MEENKFSTLSLWLKGKESLKMFLNIGEVEPFFEIGSFISLDKHYYLHEVDQAPAQSLSTSWEKTNKYIEEAIELIDGDYEITLDKEEAYWVQEELGEAPRHCYPIYIVTVGEEEKEKIVYVGKTSARKNRFSGGHSVALKLHNPKYNGLTKNVYFGCIVFLTKEKNYLPLEWIHPKEKSLELLDEVESYLIYRFLPELNIQKKNKNYCKYDLYFHIQNFSGHSNFLNNWQG